MNPLHTLLSLATRRRTNPVTDGTPKFDKGGLPVKRVSLPTDIPLLARLNTDQELYNFVIPKHFPFEMYDLLTNLTLQNPDLRQAVGHIVQLGNTGHLISVQADNDSQIDAAVARIEKMGNQIFPYSVGPDGLINALFGQIARTGAVSTEWVPNRDLTGVDKVFLVPVSEIRWVPRADRMGYYPVQMSKHNAAIITGKLTPVLLNPRTYHYASLETLENTPYAIPPFLAALESVAMQRLMIKNIQKIVKKVGIMGLLTYSVAPPQQRPGELEDAYYERCLAYLTKVTDQVKGSFSEGIAAGFKGSFDFDVKSVTGDARGIAEIFKLNEEQLFSAIGADPAMHGRTYSTTETYASVVYSKMISQLNSIQNMVAHSLEFGWGLDLALAGLTADIIVSFKTSQALSNLQEAQSDMINIANAAALYREGVIDQNEKARRCGYTTPAEAEPLPDPALTGATDQNIDQRGNGGTGKNNKPSADTVRKKQGNKEKHSARFVLGAHGRYQYVADMNYLELSGHVSDVQVQQHEHNATCSHDNKPKDKVSESRYRRYLQRGADPNGPC